LPQRPTVGLHSSLSAQRAPVSTASNALPPVDNTFHAAWLAPTPKSQVDTTRARPLAWACTRGNAITPAANAPA